MSRITAKKIVVSAVLIAFAAGATGCSTVAANDEVGLYYNQGSIDGDVFSHCIEPGEAGDASWNNEVYFLPVNQRTWNIGGEGADSGAPIVSSSKPQEGQPSGVEVQVWPKVTFKLNSFCDKEGGLLKPFWENLGRRYGADTAEGWRKMLLEVLVPPLEKSVRDVTRNYSADALVGNVEGIIATVQTEISAQFTRELKRMAGGDYFCGPSFSRASKDCPAVELLIKDVTFNDPGIQAARNEKQKAVELAAAQLAKAQGEAAALVAEAEGKRDAAAALQALYANPNWVALQKSMNELEAVKACAANPNCHVFLGSNGQILTSTK